MNRAAMLTAGAAGAAATAGTVAYMRRPRPMPHVPGVQVLVDGALVHYTDEGRGPAVVLVHGFGASTFSWRDVVPLLADHFRVVAIDLPGLGFSSRDASLDLSHAAQATRLIHLLDALGIEQAVLAGHSMGGGIVQRVAMAHPERVTGLVLVAATDPIDAGRFERGQRRARLLIPLMAAALKVAPASEIAVRRSLAAMTGPQFVVSREMAEGYRLPLAQPGTGAMLHKMLTDIVAEPPPSPGADIGAPCVILSGAYDTVVAPEIAERLAQRIAGARHWTLGDGGHMLTDEHPEEVASAIHRVAGRVSSE